MRVTIYITVLLFVLFVLMDPDVEVVRAWHVSPATDSCVRHWHHICVTFVKQDVTSWALVSQKADLLLANLANGHGRWTVSMKGQRGLNRRTDKEAREGLVGRWLPTAKDLLREDWMDGDDGCQNWSGNATFEITFSGISMRLQRNYVERDKRRNYLF